MALESKGDVERSRRERIFHRGFDARGDDPAFVWIRFAPSGFHSESGDRGHWVFTVGRRRREYILEEQSLSDQGFYGRGRFGAPAVGGDRSGCGEGSGRNTDYLGRTACSV